MRKIERKLFKMFQKPKREVKKPRADMDDLQKQKRPAQRGRKENSIAFLQG